LSTDTELPLTLDQVTPEWLTVAMQQRFPGVKITRATIDGQRQGTSTSARFALEYASRGDDGDAPETVYVKGGFDETMRLRVWGALVQEARFYAELAPDAPINIPAVYFAGIDENVKQGVVVMEDMAARNVRFGHITSGTSVDQVADVLTGQAKLHARFWGDSRLAAYQEWREPVRAFVRYLYRPAHWDEIRRRPYADLMEQVLPSREFGLRAEERNWEINDGKVQTLVHGDCHSGNLFFEADGSPGFMDWQCPCPAVPGYDHAEMIITSLTVEERREHERDLLKHYREELVAAGLEDAPSDDELFLSYRQNLCHNMGFSVLNPYDMQPPEVTDTAAIRSLHAAIDLDMVGALGLR
jgi:hypothetical protein